MVVIRRRVQVLPFWVKSRDLPLRSKGKLPRRATPRPCGVANLSRAQTTAISTFASSLDSAQAEREPWPADSMASSKRGDMPAASPNLLNAEIDDSRFRNIHSLIDYT
jgi:hypothetical protein